MQPMKINKKRHLGEKNNKQFECLLQSQKEKFINQFVNFKRNNSLYSKVNTSEVLKPDDMGK